MSSRAASLSDRQDVGVISRRVGIGVKGSDDPRIFGTRGLLPHCSPRRQIGMREVTTRFSGRKEVDGFVEFLQSQVITSCTATMTQNGGENNRGQGVVSVTDEREPRILPLPPQSDAEE